MAPELLRDARPSVASDIYAMGLIIDEMVTPSRAFPAESLHSLYYQKLWEAPIPPRARRPELPAEWDQAILRCLAPEPSERFARAAAILAALETTDRATSAPEPARVAESASPKPSVPGRPASKWRIRRGWSGIIAAAAAAMVVVAVTISALVGPGKSSVVVFPIENLGNGADTNRPDLNYLCKGIAAELMRRLTLLDGVQVIPYYEPRSKTQISQLRERFSLSGLLQTSGNRIRLTAQLTNNRDGTLVWSQNFERDIQSPLQLQSDIADGSVRALQVGTLFGRPVGIRRAGLSLPVPLLGLLGFQRAAVPPAATTNPAAFDAYLRGQYLFEERTVPAALDAIRCYHTALQEDPNFALAYAAAADAEFVLMDYEYATQAVLAQRAREFAEKAIRIAPGQAEPYVSLGAVGQAEGNFSAAEDSYKRAVQLNPRLSRAHRWYSGLLMQFGRQDDSLEEMQRAIELDPYDYSAESNQGLFFFYSRRYKEAVTTLEDALAHKELVSAHIHLGRVYCALGRGASGKVAHEYFSQALRQADAVEASMRRTISQSPSTSGAISINYSDRMHAEYYTLGGRLDEAAPYLDRLKADTTAGRISPVSLGIYYAQVGDADHAMPLLNAAAAAKDRQILFLKVMPEFDRIRRDPRFVALLHSIGLS
jgi:TolB-like protein/tetratricopeptide (TPR) repeat protein